MKSTKSKRRKTPVKSQEQLQAEIAAKKIRDEFTEWKKELKRIIDEGSYIDFADDGGYSFILPPRLVSLVWSTSVKEKMRENNMTARQAITSIKGEINDKALLSQADAEAEEERAAKQLEEYRKELVANSKAKEG